MDRRINCYTSLHKAFLCTLFWLDLYGLAGRAIDLLTGYIFACMYLLPGEDDLGGGRRATMSLSEVLALANPIMYGTELVRSDQVS